MTKKRPVISVMVIAAMCLGLMGSVNAEAQSQTVQDQSLDLFRTGVQYFDQGIDASNVYDYNAAKKYVRLALSIFLTSRALDPENSYAKGFIYLAKGYMYHLSGTQMRLDIQADSNPYTVLVQLRRAYYPLKHAQYYYDLSLEYIDDQMTRDYVERMQARNNEEVKLVKQFLPQVDYKASRFLKAIETEAAAIVNFDKINDLIMQKNYAPMRGVIEKNKKLAKKLKSLKSDNTVGFMNLTKAYADLIPVLEALDAPDAQLRGNAAFLGGQINTCIEDTRIAEAGFRDMALSDLCQQLRDNVMKIRASIRKRTGVMI